MAKRPCWPTMALPRDRWPRPLYDYNHSWLYVAQVLGREAFYKGWLAANS